MTIREALRQAAEDYKGVAALVGAFVAGAIAYGSVTGAITIPTENQEAIQELQDEVAGMAATTTARHEQVQEQVDAVVSFVESQALLNCTLMNRLLDEGTAQDCLTLPRVLGPGR